MCSQEKIQQAIETILSELGKRQLSASTIQDYRFHYQELLSYISEENITEIKGETFFNFLKIRFDIEVSDFYVKGLDHRSNRRLRPLALLNSYLETDSFNPACRQASPPFACPDGFLESYESFLEYLMNKGLKTSTLRTNRKTVERLIQFLSNEGVGATDLISAGDVNAFFAQFEGNSLKHNGTILYVLRNYLSYLFQEGFLEINLSDTLPHLRVPRHGGIPHAWSKEELRAILKAVDREDPAGKRNYAILLLVIQTGLRSADIRRLQLKDIDWKGHRIRIITGKTGQEVELPLLENTGWAIIDYLQNGRPKTDCGCVFVRHQAPYGPIGSTATLDTALGKYIMKAGITIKKGEHRGMHTLRNSLAKNMLDAGAAIPVISQTLGHADINTTAIYLKIDIEGLRQCALDPDGRGVC